MPPVDPLRPLLDAALEGDDLALGELVRRSQAAIWRLCRALGSPGTEDDLVQETYLRAIPRLAGFRGEATVQTWLLSIARRVCADDVRRRQRHRRLVDQLGRQRPVDGPTEPSSLEDLVRGLDRDRREAFTLTQVLGLSYQETAIALGCPIGTVRSRVARARADLTDLLTASEATG